MTTPSDPEDHLSWFQAKEIFNDALSVPENEVSAFVRTACQDDDSLFSHIMELIEEHRKLKNKTIDSASAALDDIITSPYLKPGDVIDKFTVIRHLSSGGMGEVYLAERHDDEVRQKVALKLIRNVFLSQDAQIRFQNEKRILAALEHPGIARLIDSGRARDYSFYIMEYVEGSAIDAYCNDNQLSIRQRTQLLIQVCEVIGFAHNNLIVHRDLKPENIMVTKDGQVKLLDFGIAKSIRSEAHSLIQTSASETLLTPQYAAPEQFNDTPPAVASDVYALGALAYVLFTGQPALPCDNHRWQHIERTIKEVIPIKPSSAVSTSLNPSDLKSPSIDQIAHQLKGDLDAIVLTCLKKEPTRRYATAWDLAKDLRAHISHHPISVSHNHWLYRCKKFFRRHRSISLMFGLLLITVVSAFFFINQQKQKALEQSRISHHVTDFLINTFRAADPNQNMGADISVREILRTGIHQLENQPLEDSLKSQLLLTFSEVLFHRSEFSEAQKLLDQIHVDFRNNSAETILLEARLLNAMEQFDLARTVMLNLEQQLSPQDPLFIKLLQQQSRNSLSLDYPKQALQKTEQSVQLSQQLYGSDSMEYALSLRSYGAVLSIQGDLQNAENHVQKALAIMQQHFQQPNLEIAYTQMRLAIISRRLLKYQQALELAESANTSFRVIYQDQHAVIASTENLLGTIKRKLQDPQLALVHFDNSIAVLKKFYGENSLKQATPLYNSALLLWEQLQQPEQALDYFYRALDLIATVHGENHLNYHYMQIRLAQCLIELNRMAEARDRLNTSLSFFENRPNNRGVNLAITRGALGQIAYFDGRLAEAVSLLQASLPVLKQHMPPHHSTFRNGCVVWQRLRAHSQLSEISDQDFCETTIQ